MVRLKAQTPVTPGLMFRWQDSVTLDKRNMEATELRLPRLLPSVFCDSPEFDSPPLWVYMKQNLLAPTESRLTGEAIK